MAEREFPTEAAARVDPDAEVSLAAFEDGFKLRIAFKALLVYARRQPGMSFQSGIFGGLKDAIGATQSNKRQDNFAAF